MRAKGLTKKEVLAKLKQANQKDQKYRDGKILCSMCTTPHPVAKTAHKRFMEANHGDPALFP
jgi:tyrosine decarboxylase/aspartate 1-decarboxylase